MLKVFESFADELDADLYGDALSVAPVMFDAHTAMYKGYDPMPW